MYSEKLSFKRLSERIVYVGIVSQGKTLNLQLQPEVKRDDMPCKGLY